MTFTVRSLHLQVWGDSHGPDGKELLPEPELLFMALPLAPRWRVQVPASAALLFLACVGWCTPESTWPGGFLTSYEAPNALRGALRTNLGSGFRSWWFLRPESHRSERGSLGFTAHTLAAWKTWTSALKVQVPRGAEGALSGSCRVQAQAWDTGPRCPPHSALLFPPLLGSFPP